MEQSSTQSKLLLLRRSLLSFGISALCMCFAGKASANVIIGDRVWLDANGNGIQDASESGIAGVTVKLRNASGTVIATTTTDINGNYHFTGLPTGTYSVLFPLTVGSAGLTAQHVGSDGNVDSDPNVTTGITQSVSGVAPQTISNLDAGYVPDCSCTNGATNLLTNGSFENGSTGWTVTGGNLTTGTGYVTCGSQNGFLNETSGTAKLYQDVTVAAGNTISFKGYAGTHTPGISCSPKLSLIFLNGSNAVISQLDVPVTRDVDTYGPTLELYSLSGVAPAGTVKARVQGSIGCNTLKVDAFCLTSTPPVVVGHPDLTPRITLNPNNIIGSSSMEVTVQVNELANVSTDGSVITLYVDKLSMFSNFTFNSARTTNSAGQPVQNNQFTLDAVSNPDFYVLTSTAQFKNSLRRVVFTVTVNPGQTKGSTNVNVYLNNGSGGETNFNNNSDQTTLTFSF